MAESTVLTCTAAYEYINKRITELLDKGMSPVEIHNQTGYPIGMIWECFYKIAQLTHTDRQ